MPLEADVFPMLVNGFSFIMFVSILIISILWFKNKKKSIAFGLIISHFILFVVAGIFLLQAFNSDPSHPMASEVNSLNVGLSGVTWAISVICLLFGIRSLVK